MTNKEPVTLAAFKDYIDTHVQEGVEQATIAATAFATELDCDEFREAIHYAAEQNIELVFIPDQRIDLQDIMQRQINENPIPAPNATISVGVTQGERKNFDKEALLTETVELFSNLISHD